MPGLKHTRRTATATSLAAALALALAAATGAPAIAASKKPAPDAAAHAGHAVQPGGQGPARFFTINEILAKKNAERAGTGGRVAAVERDTATDAAPDAPALKLGPEPFGLYSFRAPDGPLWKKWRGLEADLADEARALDACGADAKRCTPEAARFAAIVAETKGREGRARLETANRLVNSALRYVSDLEQHGVPDRWTAPLAAIAAGRGDCEEYAVAKYAALRAAGVPEAAMRLVLVRDTAARIDHAVLAVRHEERWLVLDNRKGTVVESGDVRHYQPLFALGPDGVKLFAAPYASWGEGEGENSEFAGWNLRGTDGTEFAEWTLRGIDGGTLDAEPAAAF